MTLEEKKNDKPKDKKKEDEQEYIHDLLFRDLEMLKAHAARIDKTIEVNQDSAKRLVMLVNSRARIQQQILMCAEKLTNPKLKLYTDSGKQRDFASMISKALVDENPSVKKLVEEANKENLGEEKKE